MRNQGILFTFMVNDLNNNYIYGHYIFQWIIIKIITGKKTINKGNYNNFLQFAKAQNYKFSKVQNSNNIV